MVAQATLAPPPESDLYLLAAEVHRLLGEGKRDGRFIRGHRSYEVMRLRGEERTWRLVCHCVDMTENEWRVLLSKDKIMSNYYVLTFGTWSEPGCLERIQKGWDKAKTLALSCVSRVAKWLVEDPGAKESARYEDMAHAVLLWADLPRPWSQVFDVPVYGHDLMPISKVTRKWAEKNLSWNFEVLKKEDWPSLRAKIHDVVGGSLRL